MVLAGLRAVGATPAQAASGLIALCLTLGIGTILLSRRHRLPVTLAWSTPGAALLATTGTVGGGWSASVGAFLVVAALVLATALWPVLGRSIARIPAALAQAMLAGVLFPLCLAPVQGMASRPLLVGPAVLTWLVALVLARRWAVPLAFGVALVTVVVEVLRHGDRLIGVLPRLEWTTPHLTVGAALSLALPLFLVTMAAQNLPGVAVLASYDFEVPWRPSMAVTGVGTAIGAPFGAHAINLAAITAALAAGPDAGPDRARRWRAAETAGWTYVVLAATSPLLVALVSAGPAGIVEAVAGLALLGTFASAVRTALAGEGPHEPAVITLLVAASGTTILGVGAAFWSLLAGLAAHALLHRRARTR